MKKVRFDKVEEMDGDEYTLEEFSPIELEDEDELDDELPHKAVLREHTGSGGDSDEKDDAMGKVIEDIPVDEIPLSRRHPSGPRYQRTKDLLGEAGESFATRAQNVFGGLELEVLQPGLLLGKAGACQAESKKENSLGKASNKASLDGNALPSVEAVTPSPLANAEGTMPPPQVESSYHVIRRGGKYTHYSLSDTPERCSNTAAAMETLDQLQRMKEGKDQESFEQMTVPTYRRPEGGPKASASTNTNMPKEGVSEFLEIKYTTQDSLEELSDEKEQQDSCKQGEEAHSAPRTRHYRRKT